MTRHCRRNGKRVKRDYAKAQRWHFMQRARERLGLAIKEQDVREIRKLLQTDGVTGAARLVMNQSNRVGLWWVVYHGRKFGMIYDRVRHTPVTVVPDEIMAAVEEEIAERGRDMVEAGGAKALREWKP